MAAQCHDGARSVIHGDSSPRPHHVPRDEGHGESLLPLQLWPQDERAQTEGRAEGELVSVEDGEAAGSTRPESRRARTTGGLGT